MYGKATQNAIAAVSRLAEMYDNGQTRLSAEEIARSRGLQKPFVSKLLSTLATAGIVTGARGPGGGFTLARHPRKIRLYDVFTLFEREAPLWALLEDFLSVNPMPGVRLHCADSLRWLELE